MKSELQTQIESELGYADFQFHVVGGDLYVMYSSALWKWLRMHYPSFANVVKFPARPGYFYGRAYVGIPGGAKVARTAIGA